ncbi:hypothetical protein Y882_18285 [Dyella japonica DSM 16301]|uniref:Uncharacterized protein n=1 Tax=Dyella japonica DSM 16301 TaxID=1440762 RepID=A0A0G9GXI5_9GAMM|nr:hypothetical protein Y882_18285 [Dyella japonica DSM 16301]
MRRLRGRLPAVIDHAASTSLLEAGVPANHTSKRFGGHTARATALLTRADEKLRLAADAANRNRG